MITPALRRDGCSLTKEVWTAAIGGRDIPPRDHRGIAALQARLTAVQPQFAALVRRIRDRSEWDDVFVDALCTPPVSFTFGSVIAHIFTASVGRRQMVIGALADLGIQNVDMRDPIEWERLIAARG
ncbi:MAG: hypothetical protein ABI211_18865 [Vicinamibacterales bacterium]